MITEGAIETSFLSNPRFVYMLLFSVISKRVSRFYRLISFDSSQDPVKSGSFSGLICGMTLFHRPPQFRFSVTSLLVIFVSLFNALQCFDIYVSGLAKLTVNVNPRYVLLKRGSAVTIDCAASGTAKPVTITWQHNSVAVVDTDEIKVFPNNTLYIKILRHSNKGNYVCEAKIDSAHSSTTTVKVEVAGKGLSNSLLEQFVSLHFYPVVISKNFKKKGSRCNHAHILDVA